MIFDPYLTPLKLNTGGRKVRKGNVSVCEWGSVCVWVCVSHSRGCALSSRALETELIKGLYQGDLLFHLGVQSLHPDADRLLSGRLYKSFSATSEVFPNSQLCSTGPSSGKLYNFSLSHDIHVILAEEKKKKNGGRCHLDMDTHMLPFYELLCDLIHWDF